MADHEGGEAGEAAMSRLSPALMYPIFGLGLAVATLPIWRFWLFGFSPSLDELLRLRCLAF